jgi:hypothetical protein
VRVAIDFKPIVPVSPRNPSFSMLHLPFLLIEPELLLDVGNYVI